ncbi:aminoglycoside phosphotransferase family protein [Streptomyces sp. NPDC048442]|uniref:aminoglycoside phosphotransferase family protein n=1 Tax=Streptomyces sp. NPDC048442 TaxID=3154823 RepID=UPI003422ADF8
MATPVTATLAALAAATAHPSGEALAPCPHAPETLRVLADRPDGSVVRHGPLVAKAHAPDTDPAALAVRTAVAAHPLLAGVLLPPLPTGTGTGTAQADGRPLTAWPYGAPVDPEDPDAAPWEETAALLARLHRTDTAALPAPLPPMRGPAKAARAVARMLAVPHPAPGTVTPHQAPGTTTPHQAPGTTTPCQASGAATPPEAPGAITPCQTVLHAWHRLPAWARNEVPAPRGQMHAVLCHGDLHLGQLVRHPAPDGPWHLIDIDDLGLGDPTWDLARPAAWYAAGLLPPDVWQSFLAAYREADGPAVPPYGDPWPQLDVAARALTVQTAALALAKSAAEQRPLDEVEQLMLDSCARIAALPPEWDRHPPS